MRGRLRRTGGFSEHPAKDARAQRFPAGPPRVPPAMSGTDRFLHELDARFSGAIASEEDVAANDLAFSLKQDVTMSSLLALGGHEVLLPSGAAAPVALVGRDYVAAGRPVRHLVPLRVAVAVAREGGGAAPEVVRSSLVEELRRWARRGQVVTVHERDRAHTGRLRLAGKDHLSVTSPTGTFLVAIDAIDAVTALPWGSGDAS